MSQLYISPYVFFNGRAQEAMRFYQSILGGELDLLAFDPNGPPRPAGPDDNIMHSRLETDGAVIMGSDGMPDRPQTVGDNIGLTLGGTDTERLTKIFEQLSEGGQVKQPMKKESWGDAFGSLIDKFGINWMINISS